MTTFQEGHTTVLSGYGYGQHGPYLRFNDIDSSTQLEMPVLGKTFSLEVQPKRYCVGRFDLRTFKSSVCPLKVELLPDEKDTMCPACKEATGFNPSFYYANTVSPQQREYNKTPHFVYLAYFSPKHVKAGISSESRGKDRLLEQGARAAVVVGRFENADDARVLEAALCRQDGIYETMRASQKAHLLAEEPFSPDLAYGVLHSTLERLEMVEELMHIGFLPENPEDLSVYYFGTASPDVSQLQLPEDASNVIAGECMGMVGSLLVMKQGEFGYVFNIKDWESHVVDVYPDEVRATYESVPQQTSLF